MWEQSGENFEQSWIVLQAALCTHAAAALWNQLSGAVKVKKGRHISEQFCHFMQQISQLLKRKCQILFWYFKNGRIDLLDDS